MAARFLPPLAGVLSIQISNFYVWCFYHRLPRIVYCFTCMRLLLYLPALITISGSLLLLFGVALFCEPWHILALPLTLYATLAPLRLLEHLYHLLSRSLSIFTLIESLSLQLICIYRPAWS